VGKFMNLLQEEDKLMEIVQLVGSDSLPDKQQLTLETARMIREFFLQQNAFHEVDAYCELRKTYRLMKTILLFQELGLQALASGKRIQAVFTVKSKDKIADAKFDKNYDKVLDEVESTMRKEFSRI